MATVSLERSCHELSRVFSCTASSPGTSAPYKQVPFSAHDGLDGWSSGERRQYRRSAWAASGVLSGRRGPVGRALDRIPTPIPVNPASILVRLTAHGEDFHLPLSPPEFKPLRFPSVFEILDLIPPWQHPYPLLPLSMRFSNMLAIDACLLVNQASSAPVPFPLSSNSQHLHTSNTTAYSHLAGTAFIALLNLSLSSLTPSCPPK